MIVIRSIKYTVVFLLLLLVNQSFGRTNTKKIGLSPLSVNYFGYTVDVSYKWYFKKHTYSIGNSYLVNPQVNTVKPNALFANRAFATNIFERIALKGGYEHTIIHKKNMVRLHFFSELALARTKLKVESYLPIPTYNLQSPDTIYEKSYIEDAYSVTWVNSNIGLGAEIPMSKKIGLQARAGITPGIIFLDTGVPGQKKIWTTRFVNLFYSFTLNYEL